MTEPAFTPEQEFRIRELTRLVIRVEARPQGGDPVSLNKALYFAGFRQKDRRVVLAETYPEYGELLEPLLQIGVGLDVY